MEFGSLSDASIAAIAYIRYALAALDILHKFAHARRYFIYLRAQALVALLETLSLSMIARARAAE